MDKTQSSRAGSLVKMIFVFVFTGLFVLSLAMLTGCSEEKPQREEVNTNENENVLESDDSATIDNIHELVYLGNNGEILSAEEFDGDGLWGVTMGGSDDVVILHIGEGGIVDEAGNKLDFSELQYGDVVEAEFDIVSLSFPGQVSVEQIVFLRHGGDSEAAPYEKVLVEMENQMQGTEIDTGMIEVEVDADNNGNVEDNASSNETTRR